MSGNLSTFYYWWETEFKQTIRDGKKRWRWLIGICFIKRLRKLLNPSLFLYAHWSEELVHMPFKAFKTLSTQSVTDAKLFHLHPIGILGVLYVLVQG